MAPERVSRGEFNPELEKKASAILRYIESKILAGHESDPEVEAEIRATYQSSPNAESRSRTPREKADILYEKVMAYVTDKKAGVNADLITEIKVLFEDRETKDLFLKTYSEARVDTKSYRMSDLGKTWKHLNEQIEGLEEEFKKVEQALFLRTVEGKSNISAAKSKAERLANRLLMLKTQRENMKQLNLEKVHPTAENTDIAAAFQFETLVEYRDQLKKGFVWLPSRQKIHTDTVAALQNGRWPVLIGEAGTGKSDQADAAALELTNSPPTEVDCVSTTGEKQLIMDTAIDSETGGSYQEYGPLMRAFTGFNNSREKKPSHLKGRVARFDEAGRLGSKAYTIIKKARQKGPGDDFYGHPVLPGAAAIWTTNPVGTRYPDRRAVDPAMRREIAEIIVDYPDQSAQSPELYEFMLGALLDENKHIPIAEKELTPAYVKHELADAEKVTLPDGRVVVAKDVLIEDGADPRHSTLWRLANAVKTLQNSFIYGNQSSESIPTNAVRFVEDSDGNITLDASTGELLTLSSSTITLGEIKSWMQGFKDRLQKQNQAFQVESFSEWIKLKIDIYLKQVDQADRAKVRAIFDYFHLLDGAPDLKGAKPITPKKIGYLSPRVPRPLHVEMPPAEADAEPAAETEDARPAELYTTIEVSLEDGGRINIRKGEQKIRTKVSPELAVGKKTRFTVDGSDYSFAGTLEEGESPVGSFLSEPDLHKVFTPEQVEKGMVDYSFQKLEKDVEALCEMTKTEQDVK
ncbi:hypothetical protein EPN81_02170 [Patescibacteria group bacterium]|nr:MAG: hypothetical protein EPN81_02170 [Patescibacteria group bacterium]